MMPAPCTANRVPCIAKDVTYFKNHVIFLKNNSCIFVQGKFVSTVIPEATLPIAGRLLLSVNNKAMQHQHFKEKPI